jgi:circadian clock protein KaiC
MTSTAPGPGPDLASVNVPDHPERRQLPKTPTGIRGLDEVTGGGLPSGRPTLICGSAGCGKTLLGMEFLVRGATNYGEPGVFLAFEERPEELAANVRSLGFEVDELIARRLLAIDHVHLEPGEIDEIGDYDLEGLFVRLGHAIDSIGARRVVLDTIEALFSGFSNHPILRAELRRLFRWLKDRGVTAIITCERGEGALTRHGLEEYVSDCVILLDHRVDSQVSTRRLRVVKYRGSAHGTNEYPFLIDPSGITVLPVTSIRLDHPVSDQRVSTGISALDTMLGGLGYYRGTSILVSGTAGTGKTSVACHMADAACRRGERCLFAAFEESPHQILRNMRSIGLDLSPWTEQHRLRIQAIRPTMWGLEMHLAVLHRAVDEFGADLVVVDPISSLLVLGSVGADAMLLRLVDFLKSRQITTCLTNLTGADEALEGTSLGVSSLVDTWLLLRDVESEGTRRRALYLLKSRGMAHSHQIREYVLTPRGIELRPYSADDHALSQGGARQVPGRPATGGTVTTTPNRSSPNGASRE